MNTNKNTSIRRFILITLSHAELRKTVYPITIVERIQKIFYCQAIVVAKENHEKEGYHYHVGILTDNASKNTATKFIRKKFYEWDGRVIDVKFHKSWPSVVSYILKEDQKPLIWGDFSLAQLKDICYKKNQHKKIEKPTQGELLERLEEKKDILEIYDDDLLREKILSALPRIKEAFDDLVIRKMKIETWESRIKAYLEEKGYPKEYTIEEIQEKYLLLDWIACQLCFRRPLKTKQLFLYGEPSTQKTLIFQLLQKVLNIYFVSSRRNDFTGANDYYDLWVFDEFHEPSEDSGIHGATEEGTTFANTILKVLDGQECRLDSKYARIFTKRKNVPIIMIANSLPSAMLKHGPFRARFLRLCFQSNLRNLNEERIIATLWGCCKRRIEITLGKNFDETLQSDTPLEYNNCEGIFVPKTIQNEERINKLKNIHQSFMRESPWLSSELGELYFYTREGQCLQIQSINIERKKENTEDGQGKTNESKDNWENAILLIKNDKNSFVFQKEKERGISLIDFAIIPLKKTSEDEDQNDNENTEINSGTEIELNPFKNLQKDEIETLIMRTQNGDQVVRKGKMFVRNTEGYFIYRNQDFKIQDYATWPLQLVRPMTPKEKSIQRAAGSRYYGEIKKATSIILKCGQPNEWKDTIRKDILRELLKIIEKNPKPEETLIYKIEIALNGEENPWTTKD